MKEKLAVFDVDGTLFDGNLGIEFLKELMKRKIFPEKQGMGIMEWYGKYRNGEVEKGMAVDEIYKLYALGMAGIECEVAEKVASEVCICVKSRVFGFVNDMLDELKRDGYEIALISGSPVEMIGVLADDLNIRQENVIAGNLVIKDGKYTGGILSYPAWAQQKVEAVNKLVKDNEWNVDWENSIAMGDNERDVGILEMVGKAIAFRPSEKLRKIAEEKGWKIVEKEEEVISFLH